MAAIEHVVVLAMENRSFDHMLGALEHPDAAFDGLNNGAALANPGWEGAPAVTAGVGARPWLPVGPEHAHDCVMAQLGITATRPPWQPTNTGFVVDYERACRGLVEPRWAGLLGGALNWLNSRGRRSASPITGRGPLAMLCQAPGSVPVLSTLAREFALCQRWFSSVPGETWPNRNFLHAATSDGEVNIDLRLYENPTIFDRLESAGASWRIYHDDTPQVWAFKALWDTEERHANWFAVSEFAAHVAAGTLASYTFIEPNHRPPFHTLDHAPLLGSPDVSNNQHPENNLVADSAYDTFSATDTDFSRGERLIATVYEALRASPELFARTLLVITYDEHGGFFDHVPPPTGVPAPAGSQELQTRLFHWLLHRRSAAFDFSMLGVRVPAVVVSPLIDPGTIDSRVRDHASVPATLRALFAPTAEPLTARDAWSPPWHDLAARTEPRTDLPDLSAYAAGGAAPEPPAPPAPPVPAGALEVPDYYRSFLRLADDVGKHLAAVHEEEAGGVTSADPVERAAQVTDVFQRAAERHRAQGRGLIPS